MADTFDESAARSAEPAADDGLLVVGLGASAGGISALQRFFANVPPDTGAAYAVILHLSPDHDSRLAEVLQSTTPMPIEQVKDRVKLLPDHVYVIAPDCSLSISEGHIVAGPITNQQDRRAPVDLFFRTLAESQGRNAVAVVLSGTGPNGSSGLKRVKEKGGLAIAQDPLEAEYNEMPQNAIASGLVDYVVPVAEIPQKIVEYHRRLRQVALDVPRVTHVDADADALRDIVTLLRARTGHDFANYKPSTVLRRIERRVSVVGVTTLPEYAHFMHEHPAEAAVLMKELLISVTNFFRDPTPYLLLEQRVVPQLFYGKSSNEQVRVWVAGCATGEEAYSVTMLLAEYAAQVADAPRIVVFASDLDERAIASAREGFYTEAEAADLPPERLQRFFLREAGGYRVRRELRELIIFAQHNLLRDPPFSHLDLLTCRNVLIYLNRSIQERLLETFHFALRPGGYLFLGTSESPDTRGDLFATVDKDAHVYESRGVTSRLALPLAEQMPMVAAQEGQRRSVARVPDRVIPIDLHHRLLEEYAPPSLVVTDGYQLVHISQQAAQYLQIGRGEPSRDVLQLVHPDLRLDLRTALYQAAQQRANVAIRGIRFPSDQQQERTLSIVVRPVLHEDDVARGFFLVIFSDDAQPPPADTLHFQSPQGDHDNREIEDELVRVKAQLGVTIEQYETQVEEAKAANEELQAANEELRSSTEELETSKEELQSVNEELTTVNQELKIKIDELRLTNNDFLNFMNATSIPTIFLDRSLRVKLTTVPAQEVFNLLPSDVGRRLSDITSKITYGEILNDAAEVLETLQTVEREVVTRDGHAYLMRILPYRTIDDRIEGVVLTFIDVTTVRRAEADVIASESRLRLMIENAADYAIFTIAEDGRIETWNLGAERMFGYQADAIIGHHIGELFTPEDREAGVPEAELQRARTEGRSISEGNRRRQDGSLLPIAGVTTQLGPGLGYAKIAHDLTASRAAEERLLRARTELEDRVRERTADLERERERVRGLLRRLVSAQEEQRARIARDLHDQLGQQLTALRLMLERGQHQQSSGRDAKDVLEPALKLLADINGQLDLLAWQLRPTVLDDLGLAAAIPRFVDEWMKHYGIRVEFRAAGFHSGDLSKDAEVTFYRVTQEALNNVLKHAHASRVDVVLESRDGMVNLVVSDDGVGFDPASVQTEAGLGLMGMQERAHLVAATLEIESAAGQGTTVYLRAARAPSKEGEQTP